MASSRLEKIGTIFSRVTGLLRSGAMKEEDKPLWYNIYKAFPPQVESTYDRPAPNIPVRNVFYAEDQIRAKFHRLHGDSLAPVDMTYSHAPTTTQRFLGIYRDLKEGGNIPEEQLFDAAVDAFKTERLKYAEKVISEEPRRTKSLASTFREAESTAKINIKDIFRE